MTIAAMLVLAGCITTPPEPSPSGSESASAAATAAATPTPTPTAARLALVDCETMLPIALARALFSDNTEFFGERPVTEFSGWFELPEITAALAGSPQARLCTWGVPNSGGSFSLHVAQVTPEIRAAIEAALPGAGFSSVVMGTVTAYEATGETEISSIAATHLFTRNLWIMCNAGSLSVSGAVTGSALDALRTANPTLGL